MPCHEYLSNIRRHISTHESKLNKCTTVCSFTLYINNSCQSVEVRVGVRVFYIYIQCIVMYVHDTNVRVTNRVTSVHICGTKQGCQTALRTVVRLNVTLSIRR